MTQHKLGKTGMSLGITKEESQRIIKTFYIEILKKNLQLPIQRQRQKSEFLKLLRFFY